MPGANRELFHKGHYLVLAKRIREARETPLRDSQAALDMVVNDLADWFSEDNPRFERDTWLEATNTKTHE